VVSVGRGWLSTVVWNQDFNFWSLGESAGFGVRELFYSERKEERKKERKKEREAK
tara:strand:- start:638 stop:802 length:165 start_codon:yes stop_codon:yes gene_type:complete